YWVAVGAPYEQVETVLHGLLLTLAGYMPLIVSLATGGGYWLMRRALLPVDVITQKAEGITSTNLSQRLPVIETGDELQRLSISLNGTIARLDAGEGRIEKVRLDLGKLAASTAEQMHLLAEEKSISIQTSALQQVWVECDRARLKQVVVNLIDNAIKYTPQGGEVSVVVTSDDRLARLEVTDNGIGISPDALPHIFERFYRADKARSRESGGSGLGLAIVKAICSAHGGDVKTISKEGAGSRFIVELRGCEPGMSDTSESEAGRKVKPRRVWTSMSGNTV